MNPLGRCLFGRSERQVLVADWPFAARQPGYEEDTSEQKQDNCCARSECYRERRPVVGFNLARHESSLRSSASEGEPQDQRLGKARPEHSFLNRGDVVSDAPEFHFLLREISDGKSGARIAVARLADRTGIEQIRRGGLESKFSGLRVERHLDAQRLDAVVAVHSEAALKMRVAEERERRWCFEQAVERLRLREDVLVLVTQSTVDERHSVKLNRTGRKLLQVFE